MELSLSPTQNTGNIREGAKKPFSTYSGIVPFSNLINSLSKELWKWILALKFQRRGLELAQVNGSTETNV